MRVALVHDDLVQWGGAERVLHALTQIFPDAPIYTSVCDLSNKTLKHYFSDKKITTSFMQKIPGWKNMYKALLPLYPIAFEQFEFSDFDLVISHTTRFAKAVLTKPGTFHVSMIHTPPRFLWNFSGETVPEFPSIYFNFLKNFDKVSINRVDKVIACSFNAAKRIKDIYEITPSAVIQPFVDLERFSSITPFNGDYYLIISRLNHYKRVDIAVTAFNKLGKKLRIVGKGPMMHNLTRQANFNIEFLNNLNEELLNELIAGCKALIVTAEEDFGLTSLEAQAAGKPVIAYKKGGSIETVIDGKTGLFFDSQTTESLMDAIERFEVNNFSRVDCISNAENFSIDKFKGSILKNCQP